MTAFRFDMTRANDKPIEQGATFSLQFRYWLDEKKTNKKNLDGYTARMQARDAHDSAATVIDITNVISNGTGIVLGASASPETKGLITINLSRTFTEALTAPFKGVWDLELEKDGVVERFAEGKLEITPEVTRSAPGA